MISLSIPDFVQWSKFIKEHPNGNIFQTPFMYLVYSKTKNYFPIVISSYNQNKLAGILMAVIQKESNGIVGKLSSRSIISGGPLIVGNNFEDINKLLFKYDSQMKNEALYTQIRNLEVNTESKVFFEKSEYKYSEHLNYLLDLNQGEKKIWETMNKKRRNTIRKAIKSNLKIVELDNLDEVHESYDILKKVYEREKIPLADKSLFINSFKILSKNGMLKCFFAEYEGKRIGTLWLLCYGNRVYDWYSGSNSNYRHLSPNDLIIWRGIEWSIKNNFEIFDFGGAGKPGVPYGVRDFKKKFGGKAIIPGRYEKIYSPKLLLIVKTIFNLWNKVR